MPETGENAPDFELNDSFGKKVRLSDFLGKFVVLYFYPRDDTPGCTVEACSFRDESGALKGNGIEIIGVSRDDEKSHQKFAKKFGLNFTLLCDTKSAVCKKYGVLTQKNFFGKKITGIKRTTFLIGKNGVVLHVFENVKVLGHSREILEKIIQLNKLSGMNK